MPPPKNKPKYTRYNDKRINDYFYQKHKSGDNNLDNIKKLDIVVNDNWSTAIFPGEKIHYLLQNIQTCRRNYCLRKNKNIAKYNRRSLQNKKLK